MSWTGKTEWPLPNRWTRPPVAMVSAIACAVARMASSWVVQMRSRTSEIRVRYCDALIGSTCSSEPPAAGRSADRRSPIADSRFCRLPPARPFYVNRHARARPPLARRPPFRRAYVVHHLRSHAAQGFRHACFTRPPPDRRLVCRACRRRRVRAGARTGHRARDARPAQRPHRHRRRQASGGAGPRGPGRHASSRSAPMPRLRSTSGPGPR